MHQAVPDVHTKLDIHIWSQEFVRYEMFKDILGKRQDCSGLEAYLAYKPWANAGNLAAYLSAVNDGRIYYLPDTWAERPLEQELRTLIGQPDLTDSQLDAMRPEVLPSQAFLEIWTRAWDKMSLKERNQEYRYFGQAIESIEKISKESLQ